MDNQTLKFELVSGIGRCYARSRRDLGDYACILHTPSAANDIAVSGDETCGNLIDLVRAKIQIGELETICK